MRSETKARQSSVRAHGARLRVSFCAEASGDAGAVSRSLSGRTLARLDACGGAARYALEPGTSIIGRRSGRLRLRG